MNQPIIVTFTNPNTVDGTMNQLLSYSRMKGKEIEVKSSLLENTFDLIMHGKKNEYIESVSNGLINIIEENPKKSVVAAQLSMVPAAQLTEKKTDIPVRNHLESLSRYMKEVLALVPKT
ncbi:hypothetical protein QPK24_04885 [Paenibacillus polygoni]|uniref:Uncharacterized protein n=1 Tax=Paenibacillus polygoni TaxID=3050112 RepID=A0ABY8X3E3_9BACL|nr:hypothetical protein [Paenibacillus polygoni]WIV20055.1 hypothetical protein QPK24_04885 [Paenibacillus polygoni]